MKLINIALLFLTFNALSAQNTVGTLSNSPQSFDGYTLFAPAGGFNSYLVDNCGQVVNSWNSSYLPGLACYLLEDGSIMRAGRLLNSSMNMGGLGGILEKTSWGGFTTWRYRCSGPDSTSHHDFEVLPNGNVLLLVAYKMPISDAYAMGLDSNSISGQEFFTESVLEIEPIGVDSGIVVWRWDAWDHLIQDRDSSKPNFGTVADHPERININYLGTADSRDWLHSNSIDYNPELDQIVIGLRNTSEIWVIDHSTNITESASNFGGRYGKGGDLLYRWGNPAAYDRGTTSDQKLFGPHDIHWIPTGYPGEGNFLIFNNGDITGFSEINEFNAPNDSTGFYSIPQIGSAYGPLNPSWSYADSTNPIFNSGRLSSAQRMPNGNTLICSGQLGYFSEVDNLENLHWSYRNPVTGTGILSQGNPVPAGGNQVFAVRRYGADYPGLSDKDLSPGNPIELNFNNDCILYPLNSSSTVHNDNEEQSWDIYPNPSSGIFNINSIKEIKSINITSIDGTIIKQIKPNQTLKKIQINISDLNSGLFFISINNTSNFKQIFVKQ